MPFHTHTKRLFDAVEKKEEILNSFSQMNSLLGFVILRSSPIVISTTLSTKIYKKKRSCPE
jgi:hypothetical protein